MISSLLLAASTLWSLSRCAHVPRIQNGIVGEPEVICDIRHIRITMKTTQPFSGNLYSKGFFHKSECRARGNSSGSSIEIVLPVDSDCGIRRRRMMNPRGILLDTIIILMFHPVFLTQTDRSYHVQCQYTESDRTVTNTLDVSMRAASELPESIQQQDEESGPVCKYEVLMESAAGPPLSHATVGDLVYHKWSCDGSNTEMYCMTVHSCIVDDGQGFGQKLVDEQGCTLDSFILKELDYKEKGLEAGQMASVFKFADKPTVFFSCMIRVELKESAETLCVKPSQICKNEASESEALGVMTKKKVSDDIPRGFPKPPNGTRLLHMNRLIRRAVENSKLLADFDVAAPSVNVQDPPESEVGGARNDTIPRFRREESDDEVCFTRTNLILSLLILVALGLATVSLMYLVISRVVEKEARNRSIKKLPLPDFSS